jgi:Domain of unknown function (DUF4157)
MRAQDQEPASTSRSQPRKAPTRAANPAPMPLHPAMPLTPQAILHLQRTVGNAVVARSIARQREAAHADGQQVQRSAAGTEDRQEDQHAHGPGCGHDGAKGSGLTGQRSLLDAALASPSRSLPDSLRAETEPFFHNDFSGVRLHDGPVAQRATEAMGAQAMTVGSHLFLPPEGTRNKVLVGHEFSHLDKNLKGEHETGTDNGAGVTVTDPAQRSERTADTDGAAFAAGAGTAPSVIAQRAATVQALHHIGGKVAVTRMLAEQDGSPRPVEPTAQPLAARPLHVQRVPVSVSDESSEFEVREQESRTTTRAPSSVASSIVQRVNSGGSGTKKRKREERQGTLMQFGVRAPHASDQEELVAISKKERDGRFIEELCAKFNASNGWAVKGSGDKMYAIRNDTQSGPHDYKDAPEVESLRWISTVVKRYLINDGQNPGEVQAAIGDSGRDSGKLIIAANTIGANNYLNSQIGDGMSFVGTALESGPLTGEQFDQEWEKGRKPEGLADRKIEEAAVGREGRHFRKLGLLHSRVDDDVSRRYRKVLDTIGEGVVVATGGKPGLHAERRIRIHNNNVTPEHLAGTKRPCATCFSELYPEASKEDIDKPDAIRSGVFFFNEWSNVDVLEYDDSLIKTPSQRANSLFRRIDDKVRRTHMSKSRNGANALGNGSDSDEANDLMGRTAGAPR